MLTQRLDVPFNGPQLMAFAIAREPFEAFTVAYDRALTDADNRSLVELWQANVGRYVEERARIDWRVPPATFQRMVQTACNAKHVRKAPKAVLDVLTASLERTTAHVTGDGEVRPPAWFDLEDAYLALLGNAPRRIDSFRDIALSGFIEALDAVSTCRSDRPPVGPVGDLTNVRELRFRSEDGRSVAPETVNAYDTCSGPRITELQGGWLPAPPPGSVHVIAAIEHANACIAFDSVLETLVGPYRQSQGPGPFLGCPAASRAFGPSAKPRAPLFRVPRISDFSGSARWIAGAALHDALREVSATMAPDPRWWRDNEDLAGWVDSTAAEITNTHDHDLPFFDRWQTWEELTSSSWTVARDRFASLLRCAATNDEAVVLIPQTSHCDMDGANAPRSAVWGAPLARAC